MAGTGSRVGALVEGRRLDRKVAVFNRRLRLAESVLTDRFGPMEADLMRREMAPWLCDRCDFRSSRHGHTTAPWPPRFAERGCGQAPSDTSKER